MTEGERPEVWTYRTVTFKQPGPCSISISGEWGEESVCYIELKSCRGGSGSFLRRFDVCGYTWLPHDFDIEEPGEYLLQLARPLDAPMKLARPLDAPSEIEFFISGTYE